MTTELTAEELLSAQYDILGHGLIDNSFTELRIFRPVRNFFVQSKEQFIETALRIQADWETDIYVGINPRGSESGSATDISYLSCLVVDIDPVRPKETASTDEQRSGAIAIANRIVSDRKRGYVVDSGSGAHIYFPLQPIKVENTEALTSSLRDWMNQIKETYGTKEYKIDHIFDLPRVIRLWGSHNYRSDRQCKPLGPISEFERWNYSFSQHSKAEQVSSSTGETFRDRFNQLVRTNKRLAEIVEGNVSHPSKSEADFEFVSILGHAHFTVEEIKALWENNKHGNPKPKKGDVERIVADKLYKDRQPTSYSLRTTADRYFTGLDGRKMGIRTGFNTLDELTSGLKGGKIYIYAARPNVGKTTFITQVLLNIAEQGKTCLYFPTEVGSDPIFDKIVSQKTNVNLKKFQNGTFTEADKSLIAGCRPALAGLPLIVVEDFGLTVEKIEQGIRQYAPDVVAIDFFQCLAFKDPDSVGEKNDAVRKIKQIAVDLNIPIIIASQLNRGDGKLDLKQLKGAGALEELGDVISYLIPGNALDYPVPYELNVMKSKYSATGLVPLYFYRSISKFTETPNERNDSNHATA